MSSAFFTVLVSLSSAWALSSPPPFPPSVPSPPLSPPETAVDIRTPLLIGWLCIVTLAPFVAVLLVCLVPSNSGSETNQSKLAKPRRTRLRVISKPFFRWSFEQGRRFTDVSIDYFVRKYMRKYLIKRQKLKLDGRNTMPAYTVEKLVGVAAAALRRGTTYEGLLEALHDTDTTPPQHTNSAQALAQFPRMAHNADALEQFAQFAIGLHTAASTNVGLSHAKAREYWIYRGPRQLLTTITFIVGVFMINECIREQSFEDRVVNISTSMLATLVAGVMLYYRLPDSIRSGVCRSAHDFYLVGKKQLEQQRSVTAAATRTRTHEGHYSSNTGSELDTDDEGEQHGSSYVRMESSAEPSASASSVSEHAIEAQLGPQAPAASQSQEPDSSCCSCSVSSSSSVDAAATSLACSNSGGSSGGNTENGVRSCGGGQQAASSTSDARV